MKRKTAVAIAAVAASALLLYLNIRGERSEPLAVSVSHEQKMWCLAASAVLTQRNDARHDLLAGVERTDREIDRWMRVLSEQWGVTDRISLLETLAWIRDAGHRQRFDEMAALLVSPDPGVLRELERRAGRDEELASELEVVRSNHAQLGSRSLTGWDFSRYISLCRWGYLVGYIDEEEAWELILPAAHTLQATFDSWEDLGRNYLIGRAFWSLEATRAAGDKYTRAYEWLCADPASPWQNIPWELDLTASSITPETGEAEAR